MKKITLWYRYNERSKKFEYNHHEEGWDSDIIPKNVTIDFKFRWAREIAYMDGTTVRHINET